MKEILITKDFLAFFRSFLRHHPEMKDSKLIEIGLKTRTFNALAKAGVLTKIY